MMNLESGRKHDTLGITQGHSALGRGWAELKHEEEAVHPRKSMLCSQQQLDSTEQTRQGQWVYTGLGEKREVRAPALRD